MLVRSIMTTEDKLLKLRPEQTLEEAISLIDEHKFLSLPVVDGHKFLGYISKAYIYETFVTGGHTDFAPYTKKTVGELADMKVEPIIDTTYVEEAAEIFFKGRVRFIPVINAASNFVGILTQKSLFGIVTKVYGLLDAKLVIYSSDFIGSLSKITDVIGKHGANITNIAQYDTEIMGIQEISIRVEGQNLDKLADKLQAKGIKVREFIPAKA